MLTNNCRSIFRALFCARARCPVTVTNTGGGTNKLYGSSFDGLTTNSSIILGSDSEGIWLGSGTTPAKKTDYKLEARVGKGAATSTTTVGVDENGKVYTLYTIAFTNTTTEALKISEIGYTAALPTLSGSASVTYLQCFLLDRTLLDSPITLAAGESCAIRYRLTNQFAV